MPETDQFNVRVPISFKQEIKIYAIEHNMTVSEVLQSGFLMLKLEKMRSSKK